MKRTPFIIALVFVFVLGMMAGVGYTGIAGQPIKVYINGKEMVSDQPPTIINDRVFVPLRAVSESLGAKVSWDYYRQAAFIATYSDPANIEIVGPPDFQKAMRDALDLLKEKAPDDYEVIGTYTKRIVMENDGVVNYPHAGECNMTTYIPLEAFAPNKDPYWWAGILRHEAQHSYQIYRYNDDVRKTEPEAYEEQLNTLIRIGAPQYMIDFQKKAISNKGW